jgi:hypothetical protein
MRARFLDGRDHARTLDGLQLMELGAQQFGALHGKRNLVHRRHLCIDRLL